MAALSQKASNGLKDLFRDTVVYDLYNTFQGRSVVKNWVSGGCPVPPPHAQKRNVVEEYGRAYSLDVLIETGTFRGDMVYAMRGKFERLYSIEVDKALHEQAKRRLARFHNIKLVLGDSASELPKLLALVKQPALFWLDGHYSGLGTGRSETDSPIMSELQAVLESRAFRNVVLIDDAREFNGSGGYPAINDLKSFVEKIRPDMDLETKHDIIRLVPK
jgi:hypothetical protein